MIYPGSLQLRMAILFKLIRCKWNAAVILGKKKLYDNMGFGQTDHSISKRGKNKIEYFTGNHIFIKGYNCILYWFFLLFSVLDLEYINLVDLSTFTRQHEWGRS